MDTPVLAIANRAEIAVRIARSARDMGWDPVVLLAEPDWSSYAARIVGQVVRLDAGAEFDVDAVVQAASSVGASALHPGYGFLSERADLSQRCLNAGITFIGPAPETLQLAGDKIATRKIAEIAGVPLLAGSQALNLADERSWLETAERTEFPVIAKVAGAGGGRGLRVARDPEELTSAIRSALNEAGGSGADLEIFLEHYLVGARHVEVQVAGDGTRAIALGDRDCSLQRRHQKVVEEGPAPGLSNKLRTAIHQSAITLAEAIELKNLATVEFLIGNDDRYFFMEINPRLQVEHTVTEEVTGLDLVALQIQLALGGDLPANPTQQGHAIQARIYAEDPFQQFLPSPGRITAFRFPTAPAISGTRIRVDAGYETGDTVPGNYDPLIAKVIVAGKDRDVAIRGLEMALREVHIAGVSTNRPWLLAALRNGGAFWSDSHDLATAASINVELRAPSEAALGCVLKRSVAEQQPQQDAWSKLGPFRVVSPATGTFHGNESGGWQRTISLKPGASDDGPAHVLVTPAADAWETVAPEGRWLVRQGPLPSASQAASATDGTIQAPMPGKVLQIDVTPGQRVEQGDVVAVMEAMKIEMSLAAPFPGVVASVSASPGDLVGIRQVLLTIEPDTNNSNEHGHS